MLSASKVQKLLTKLLMLGKDRLVASVAWAEPWPLRTVLSSAMIAVRDKSVGKHDRRDAQRTQDQLRKNTDAALGYIRKRDLFPGAGFQTKILALDTSRLEPLPYQVHRSKFGRPMSALGQKQTLRGVRPMSALPPKADMV
jgi:hypothetical protein